MAAPTAVLPGAAHGRRTAAPRVTIDGATKRFETKTALDGVSVDVAPGSFLVLLGPSGSGKTTLLRCVAGIDRLSSGRIAIRDRLVDDGERHHVAPERRDLSMVFQDYALWPHLTASENVAFALGRLRLSGSESARRSRALLEQVGLAGLADRFPGQLSGGEQQRVALARALAANAGLLLFDEPLSNLDASLREGLRVEIATLAREAAATSIYITHDQGEAFALADSIGVLERGRLIQVGPPEDVYLRPATPFVARFTGLAGELAARVEGPGTAGSVGVRLTAVDGHPTCAATVAGHAVAGTSGRVLVRPSALRIDPTAPGRTAIAGRVSDVAFRGRGYDHAVELPGAGLLVGIHDERRWARGDRVSITIDSAGCFFFPDEVEPSAAHWARAGEPSGTRSGGHGPCPRSLWSRCSRACSPRRSSSWRR